MVGDFTFWLGIEGDSERVTGSRPSDGAASASPPSGFDPARKCNHPSAFYSVVSRSSWCRKCGAELR